MMRNHVRTQDGAEAVLSETRVIVHGEILLDATDVEAFLRAVDRIDPTTRAESGCVFYRVSEDAKHKGQVTVVERWISEASLIAHLERAETVAFVAQWSGRMKADVRVYSVSCERPL